MKNTFYLLLIAITALTSCQDDCSNDTLETVSENLIVYYSFDEDNARDQTENFLDGIVNKEHSFVQGKFGNALRVVGAGIEEPDGGHVVMPSIKFNDYSEFTINFWVFEEEFSHPAGHSFFWAGNSNYGGLYIAHMYKPKKDEEWGTKYLQFCVGATNVKGEPSPLYVDESNLKINEWNMYSMVYKNNEIKAYINSKLVGTMKQEVKVVGEDVGICRQWYDNHGGPVSSARFTGLIDEFKIFDVELNADQILRLYNFNIE